MINVIVYDNPGLPHKSLERIEDGRKIRVTPTGVLEIVGSFDEPVRVYAPGKWIEAKKL